MRPGRFLHRERIILTRDRRTRRCRRSWNRRYGPTRFGFV
jgi:hypothetical protein